MAAAGRTGPVRQDLSQQTGEATMTEDSPFTPSCLSPLSRLAAAAALLLAVTAPPASARQQETAAETYRLRGASVAVHNVAGRVEVVRGDGDDVRVEVTREGRDSGRLSVATGVVDGRQTLRVLYPEDADRVVYPEPGDESEIPGFLRWLGVDSDTEIEVRDDGRIGDGGRDVGVVSSGDGLEAWADVRILVPAGHQVAVHHGVGRARVSDVEGVIAVDIHSGPVQADGVRGSLTVDTGSGHVRATSIHGDLAIDTGSGSVRLESVSGTRAAVNTGSGTVEGAAIRADTLVVDTGSGSVDLRDVSVRELDVDTGSGSVDVALVADLDRGVIDTGSGGVEVVVPTDFGARLDLDTGSGGIDVELTARRVQFDDDHWIGTLGDGEGTFEIDTGSGGIEVRRG